MWQKVRVLTVFRSSTLVCPLVHS